MADAPALLVPDDTSVLAERDLVWRLIATLSPRARAALVLRYYVQLPDREIASVLDCAEVTVRTSAARRPRHTARQPDARERARGDVMDSLELVVRDTLSERAADAPPFRGMRPRHLRPAAALASAAAVILVIAVSITLVLIRRSSAPTASTALWREISYHGITVKVPKSLRVEYGTCGPVRNQVVVSDELARHCPLPRLDVAGTAVTLNPNYGALKRRHATARVGRVTVLLADPWVRQPIGSLVPCRCR